MQISFRTLEIIPNNLLSRCRDVEYFLWAIQKLRPIDIPWTTLRAVNVPDFVVLIKFCFM